MRKRERIDTETWAKVHALIGVEPTDISAEVGTAINCAWDMGFRKTESIAEMAKKLLRGPRG